MPSEQDSNDNFKEGIVKRAEVGAMGERMTDRQFEDMLVHGGSPKYEIAKLMGHRDPAFDLAQSTL